MVRNCAETMCPDRANRVVKTLARARKRGELEPEGVSQEEKL